MRSSSRGWRSRWRKAAMELTFWTSRAADPDGTQQPMQFQPLHIPDVILIRPRVFGDARGFFLESWEERKFAAAGIDARFVQDNHSRSGRHTLRGLHFQIQHSQGKLVRVVSGAVFDVAV